jgi:hypothetical protein
MSLSVEVQFGGIRKPLTVKAPDIFRPSVARKSPNDCVRNESSDYAELVGAFDPGFATHVGQQHVGDQDAAVGLLVVLHDRDQRAADR